MTHGYTILVGAVVLPGAGEPPAEAIAWAFDTVLAIGDEGAVRSISRGDSHVLQARGGFVVPLADGPGVRWPPVTRLEVGGPPDLAVLDGDPRPTGASGPSPRTLAVVRGGRIVEGTLREVSP